MLNVSMKRKNSQMEIKKDKIFSKYFLLNSNKKFQICFFIQTVGIL